MVVELKDSFYVEFEGKRCELFFEKKEGWTRELIEQALSALKAGYVQGCKAHRYRV